MIKLSGEKCSTQNLIADIYIYMGQVTQILVSNSLISLSSCLVRFVMLLASL